MNPEPIGPQMSVRYGAIMDGYPDDEDTAVVGIVSLSRGLGICSGSLIAPNVVLTAQHCIAPIQNGQQGVNCAVSSFGAPYNPGQLFVSTASQLTQNPGDYHAVREVVIPPGDDDGVCGRDVALMFLADPIDESEAVALVPRVDSPLQAGLPGTIAGGEAYSAIGYGNTGEFGGSGQRRRRDGLSVTCEGTGCFGFGMNSPTEWIGETGVCQGDSGGPAVDPFGRVTGVASRGAANCGIPIYGYVFGWSDWLQTEVVRASVESGLEPPRWATGWPTHPMFQIEGGEPCTNGAQCDAGLCLDGYCSRPCSNDAPCDPSFYCAAVPPGAATFDVHHCHLAEVGGSCAGEADCSEGSVCHAGYCTRTCDGRVACPDGYRCDVSDSGEGGAGLCVELPVGPACEADADCASDVCLDSDGGGGFCSRACLSGCPGGYSVCDAQQDLCVEAPTGQVCVDGPECPGGHCLSGTCTRECSADRACPGGWTCLDDLGVCGLVAVGEACVGNQECPDGVCVDGTCTRQCDDETAPCPQGWACGEAGECTRLPDDGGGCGSRAAPTSLPSALWVGMLATLAWMRRRRIS